MDIELQDLPVSQSSVDLESQSSPPRRVFWSSWVGRVVQNVRRETGTSDSVNVSSRTSLYLANVSLRSLSMLSGRLSTSGISLATTLLGSTQITNPHRELLHTITGRSLDDQYHTLTLACTWYTAYLDSKIREAWKPLFRQVLRPAGGPDLSENPSENDMGKAFKLLEEILNVLQSEERRGVLALSDIVDVLYNKELIADEKCADEQNDDNEQERCKTFQLVFVSLGIISLFFSPVLHPEPRYLQIEGHGEGDLTTVREPGGGFTRYRSKTFTSYSESLENGKDQPLYLLLRRFGKIIPKYKRRSWSGFSTPQEISPGRSDGCIDQSLVCFHTLHKVASVKIEWVDSLCLHLEFNRPKKILKVFRFPSLCLIMLSTKDKHILASLFRESSCLNGANEHDVRAYFKEVLLSYRLIFGQTDRSYKAFKQLYEQNPEPNESWKAIRLVEKLADPLLPILCGQDWESEEASQIYNGIEAEDPTSSYNASIDFPHLEDRLVKVQNYVRDHNPHTLIAIWNDRRNIPSWWTFWAVIILGVGALFFSFVQTLLQGVSLGIQIWGR